MLVPRTYTEIYGFQRYGTKSIYNFKPYGIWRRTRTSLCILVLIIAARKNKNSNTKNAHPYENRSIAEACKK